MTEPQNSTTEIKVLMRRPTWCVPVDFTEQVGDRIVTRSGVIYGRTKGVDVFDILVDGGKVEFNVKGAQIKPRAAIRAVKGKANA